MGIFKRRDFIKGLATLPFFGYFSFFVKGNIKNELQKHKTPDLKELGLDNLKTPGLRIVPSSNFGTSKIRVGLIGNGWRGPDLMRALGYAHPEWIKGNTVNGKYNKNVISYLEQEDLKVEYAGVCDTFSFRAEEGVEASLCDVRSGNALKQSAPAKIYPTYREMISDKDIDAVIIATPDHWHGRMAIDAAREGKHIFLEKPMTQTIEEALELREAVKSKDVVLQVGHQNRQQMSYKIANELVGKGFLGSITQIETYTNRNSDHGAWIRPIDERGNTENINWEEFIGDAPWEEFNPDRYFNWQRFDKFGTCVTGNQFTHAYDCVNQIVGIGIPESAMALGGTYHFKDDRDMPDVLNAIFNYPDHGLTLSYASTLKNSRYRETLIMGSDASLIVDINLLVFKDSRSGKFEEIRIDPSDPMYLYIPTENIDAISSATTLPYVRGGYGPTLVDGKRLDTTYLHLKEWIDAIRSNGRPSCDIDQGVEETVTFNMANISYRSKKYVRWDQKNEHVELV